MNLLDFVESVIDSKGNEVSKEILEVRVDDVLSKSNILESVFCPCEKKITFSFYDSVTGAVARDLNLRFEEEEKVGQKNLSFKSSHNKNHKNICPLVNDYALDFLDTGVLDLIDEINNLPLNKFPNVLACSARTVFELARDSLRGSFITSSHKLCQDIDKIIEVALKDANLSQIAQSVPCDFTTLRNVLEKMKKDVYRDLSLAVHKGIHLTSKTDIESLFIYAGVFVTVANELKKLGIKDE